MCESHTDVYYKGEDIFWEGYILGVSHIVLYKMVYRPTDRYFIDIKKSHSSPFCHKQNIYIRVYIQDG